MITHIMESKKAFKFLKHKKKNKELIVILCSNDGRFRYRHSYENTENESDKNEYIRSRDFNGHDRAHTKKELR